MAARIIAIVIALGLIAGAFVLRNQSSEPGGRSGEALKLVCVTELSGACNDFAGKVNVLVTVEPAAATADRLIAADSADLDGWVAPPAWIELVRSTRQRAGDAEILQAPGTTLARTPVVLVVERNRAGIMRNNCSGTVTWRCVGDVMGKGQWSSLPGGRAEWGQVKFGWSDPGSSAGGLATLGSTTAGYFNRSDVDSFDLDDPNYSQWLTAASRSIVRSSADPLTTMLTTGPASFAAVATTESASAPLLPNAARAADFEVLYPNPHTTLDVALATAGEQNRLKKDVDQDLKDLLVKASWRQPDKQTTSTLTTDLGMPETDGLLSLGAMERLRTKWQQELSR